MKNAIVILLSSLLMISACKEDDDPVNLAAPVATDASNITDRDFTANWNPSSGANDYELDVATDMSFNDIVVHLTRVAPSSTVVDKLLDNTEYFYRVRATLNGANPSPNSNVINVYTMPEPPVARDATNVTNEGFTANWEAVDGITNYVLYISTDNFTSDPPVYIPGYDGAVIDGNSHTVSGLESNKFYYYAVRSKADARVSEMSNSIAVETTN